MSLFLSTLLSSPAVAVPRYDYLFVTNGEGGGEEGKRFVFDDFNSGGTYPCLTSETLMDFSPNGESRGISRNYEITPTHDWLWVSITGDGGYDGCTLSSGLQCIGAARIDLSLGTFTRTWNQSYDGDAAVVPEVIGFDDAVILANKNQDELRQHDRVDGTVNVTITRTTGGSLVSDPSQMDWVDGDLFVASLAGGNPSASQCDAGTAATVGEVWLASALAEDTSPLDHHSLGAGSKPEGIDAVEIDPASDDSCPSSATHVVYVGDYCSDELDVFSVDTTASAPELTYLYSVDLDEDIDGTPSSFAGGCHPSSVAYYPTTNEVMVVCQSRGTIMRLEADAGVSDQCAPVFADVADEVALQKYSSGGNPSCSVNPTTTACGASCSPHDIGFDQFIWPGWIFVNLSDVGQIVAVDQDAMSTQRLIYRDPDAFDPRDLDLAASCPPNDPSCVYP